MCQWCAQTVTGSSWGRRAGSGSHSTVSIYKDAIASMLFKRFHDPKLAQTSYLIGCHSNREALVVDPNRDIDRYLQTAQEEGFRIAHVTETHIHADFVSGARELAHRTGARLYLSDAGGPEWSYRFAAESNAVLLGDGSAFRVGSVALRVLHMPGHTPEHLTFLV